MALFHYHDTATVQNQHQLLTCKTSKWHSILFFKNYFFRIIIKKVTKRNILSSFAFKNYGKFTDYNLEKLCPCFLALASIIHLASRGSVLEKLVLGHGLEVFLSPWPRTSCPRLHLWYVLHYSKYIAICSIDAIANCFDRFDIFHFEIDNLPSSKFCFFQCH